MTAPRVRFAPSPTGMFHVGSARSALFNWYVARQDPNGCLILRIEDTDESRNRDEWVDGIVDAMNWLGLTPDEGPYKQSAFDHEHREAVAQLLEGGLAYYCDCRADDVAARKGENKTPGYDGFCRDRRLPRGETTAVRLKTPVRGSITVHDLIRGDVTFDYAVIDDFVIAKSSGAPLFALANVVDDRRDRITHVIRGEEHLPNAPKQMMLWDALSTVTGQHVAQPVYAHLPLLVNEQRKKLSKRKDPVATEMYRDQGFLADAFVNYLSLLGWGPKGDAEIVDRATCIEQFHLEDVSHSPAFFDVKKLRALNGDYIRAMTTEDFIVAVQPWVAPRLGEWRPTTPPPWSPEQFDPALFTRMAPLIQERVSLLGEVPSMVGFFFQETPAIDSGDADKYFRGDSANQTLLRQLRDTFSHCPFDAASLHTLVLEEGEKLGLNLRKAQAPLRLAVTGSLVGPPLFESLEVLGREKVVQRLTAAIELM